MRLIFLSAAVFLTSPCAYAFYLPGAAPHDYALGERVSIFVNALTPMLTSKDDAKLVRPLLNVKLCLAKLSGTEINDKL